jgi:hypothetical protein
MVDESSRVTRQGVRDLNLTGHNGHRSVGSLCKHNFNGPSVVIGHEWQTDPLDFEAYRAEVHGKRCTWCGETRGER